MTPKQHVAAMEAALRAAKHLLVVERRVQFDCFTISPDRSYDQMNAAERAAIRRFDRVIAKIDEVLK